MKKQFVSLALFVLTTLTGAFANEGTRVTDKVKASFQKEFPGTEVLAWTEREDYLKATFVLGGRRTEAYFSPEGELLGSVRSIFFNELPLAAMTAVEKKFTGSEIMEVNEINNDGGTHYSISLEQQQKKYRLRVDASGNISSTEKLKN